MTAAPSQTRIVNKALVLLGTSQRIANIADGSALASAANAVWDDARDETLAEHPWNFAKGRAALAAELAAPAFGYAFQYRLPTDCLRWLPASRVDDWYSGDAEQEGNFLLTNAEAPFNIRYIRRVEDLSVWSIGYINVMAHRLAVDLVSAATGDLENLAQRMEERYDDALSRAKRQNAMATGNSGGRVEVDTSWTEARRRG